MQRVGDGAGAVVAGVLELRRGRRRRCTACPGSCWRPRSPAAPAAARRPGAAAVPSGSSWAIAPGTVMSRRRGGGSAWASVVRRAAGRVGRRRLRRGSGRQDQQQRCRNAEGERPQGEQAVFLFRRPAGLADGLALKEPAPHAITARLAPTTWVPRPLATNQGFGVARQLIRSRGPMSSTTAPFAGGSVPTLLIGALADLESLARRRSRRRRRCAAVRVRPLAWPSLVCCALGRVRRRRRRSAERHAELDAAGARPERATRYPRAGRRSASRSSPRRTRRASPAATRSPTPPASRSPPIPRARPSPARPR